MPSDDQDALLQLALQWALEQLVNDRPDDPLSYVSEKLLEYKKRVDRENEGEVDDTISPEREAYLRRNSQRPHRRSAISAEVLSTLEDENIELVVIPKTDETRARIKAAVRQNFLFENLERTQLEVIVDGMAEVKKAPGDTIIQQGDEGDNFYVVDSGECEILVSKNNEPAQLVLTVGPGGSFGELALMYNCPRAATVKAKGDVTLFAVDRVTFRRIIMNGAKQKRTLYETLLEKVSILSSLDKYERSVIADALKPETFNDGETIIRQGDQGDKFYIVESGEAVVTQAPSLDDAPVEMMRCHQGDYFGEIALLTNQPRAATVSAVGECRCVFLNRAAFQRLLGPLEDILSRNMSNYASYEEIIRRMATRDSESEHSSNDSECEDEEDELGDLPDFLPRNMDRFRKRRSAVSAESQKDDDGTFEFRKIPKSDESKASIRQAVGNNFLFAHLDKAQYDIVVDAMEEVKKSPGDVLIQQGEPGDNFYIVDEGECDIFLSKDGFPPELVATAGPGGSFGELALMYNCPRAATVKARTELRCWAMDRETFRHILSSKTREKRETYERILDKCPLFQSLDKYERATVADAMSAATYNDGEVIIYEGDIGDRFYVIEEGECIVTKNGPAGEVEVMRRHSGDYFGEIALLTDQPRQASVTAEGSVKLAYLDVKAFTRLLGPCEDVLKRNLEAYESYEDIINSTKGGEEQEMPETRWSDNEQGGEDDGAKEEEDEDVGELPDMPPKGFNPQRKRRSAVSAESYDASADSDFVAPVIPKTDEQREAIGRAIGNNFLFSNLPADQYSVVINAMHERKMTTGDILIKQGDDGDFFYVVESGECDIYVSKDGAEPIHVLTVGPGGSFGELALMYNCPRAATVKAKGDVACWAVDRETFRRIIMGSAAKKRAMYEGFLENVKILTSLDRYERSVVADALQSSSYDDGEAIIKQGEAGDKFYIVEEGEVKVLSKPSPDQPEVELNRLGKGDYFGEIAILSNEPRRATVTAVGPCKCVWLERQAFVRILGPCEDILNRNIEDYETYEDVIKKTEKLAI